MKLRHHDWLAGLCFSATLALQPNLNAIEATSIVEWKPKAPEEAAVQTEALTDPDWGRVWKVHNPDNRPVTVRLGIVDNPNVQGPYYGVSGRIKYESVEGDGYLEMWSVFPGPGEGDEDVRFFSRTLSPRGLMKVIRATGDWREFRLPFDASGGESSRRPTRLEINLHLPGKGTVWLTAGRFREFDSRQSLLRAPGAWWSERTAGILGAVLGTSCGLLGALIGTLAGRGRARRFVVATSYVMAGAGAAVLITGLVAVALKQPYEVWFVLILVGAILSLVFPVNLKRIRKTYEDLEIKKMRSLDSFG